MSHTGVQVSQPGSRGYYPANSELQRGTNWSLAVAVKIQETPSTFRSFAVQAGRAALIIPSWSAVAYVGTRCVRDRL